MTKTIHFPLFILVLTACSWMSCTRTLHTNHPVYIPLLDKESQMEVGAQFLVSDFGGGNLQAAYRVSPNFTIAAQGYYLSRESSEDFPGAGYPEYKLGRSAYGEVMAGWNRYRNPNGLHVFAGYGRGYIYNEYSWENVHNRLQFQTVFIQPAFSFNRKRWEGSYSLRVGWLHHFKGEINANINYNDLQEIIDLEQNSPFFVFDSGLQFRRKLKFGSLNFFFTQRFPNERVPSVSRYAVGTGLTFRLF